MQKIVLLVDAGGIDNIALDFAGYLTQLTRSNLNVIFLRTQPDVAEAETSIVGRAKTGGVEAPVKILSAPDSIEESKKVINRYCSNHGFGRFPEMTEVYDQEEVITETRFSDLLVISSYASFGKSSKSIPDELVSYILKNAECPVVIAPLSFEGINEIVFAYDGSASSVFAIKEFTHLFPELEDKKILFLEVKEDDDERNIKFKDKIVDYLKMHYSSIGYQILHGRPDDKLFGYFLGKKNALVVIGAFGRNVISSLFRKSTAHLLLKTTSLPVFITHK